MLWSPGELSKLPLPSPPASPGATGLGVLFMLEFLQAPQVALMSSGGCAAGRALEAGTLLLARKEGPWEASKAESLLG